jgi:hypothetical protein
MNPLKYPRTMKMTIVRIMARSKMSLDSIKKRPFVVTVY